MAFKSGDKKDLMELLCPALFLIFTFFVFGPFQIYITNASELFFSFGDIWWICAVTALISLSLSVGLGLLLREKLREWYICVLWGIAMGLYIQGNFILTDYGVLDGSINWEQFEGVGLWNTLFWIVCLLFPFVLYHFFPNFWRIMRHFLSIGILAVQVITLCTLFVAADHSANAECQLTNQGRFQLSKHENTVVFVLDAYDSQYFSDFIAAHPEYKETLWSDFTFYPDTVGGGIRTTLAMPQILTGQYYTSETSYPEYLETAYQTTDVYRAFHKAGYNIGIYTEGNFMSPSMKNLIMNINEGRKQIGSYSTLAYYLYRLTACRYLPHELKKTVWMYSGDFDAAIDNSGGEQSPYLIDDALFYKNLTEDGLTLQEENAFRLYHLFGTHQAYTLDAQAQRNLDGTSLEEQQIGVMHILGTYFDQMKQLGIYDNANIMILADHGEINQGQNPLLMVKKEQETKGFQVSDLPVSYINLHPTWLSFLGETDNHGKSIFALTHEDNKERFFYVNGHTAKEYVVRGNVSNPDNTHETGREFAVFSRLDKEPERYRLGEILYFDARATGSQYAVEGFSSVETTHTWTDGHRAILSIPLRKSVKKDIFVAISMESVMNGTQKTDVYVNDSFLNSYQVNSQQFEFIIPEKMLSEKKLLNIRLELSNAASPKNGEYRILGLSFKSMVIREKQVGDQETGDYQLGRQIVFTNKDDGRRYFNSGISGIEEDFSWSLGKNSQIALHTGGNAKDMLGEFQFKYIHAAPQKLVIRSGDQILYDAIVNAPEETVRFHVPAECVKKGWLTLDLEYPDAVSPKSLGENEDCRILAFAFSSIRFYEDIVS